MATTSPNLFKYPEEAKMPKGYNFSTKGKNWSQYKNDYLLRTDAVWEKVKLRDWFRLYYKVFFFNREKEEYGIVEPEDVYTMVYNRDSYLDTMIPYQGFSATGMTTAFKISLGPMERVKTSAQTNFVHTDFYELCCMRFDKWSRCDLKYGDQRAKYLAMIRPRSKDEDMYPCFTQFYEAQYACNDDLFDFLQELHYSKKVNDLHPEDIWNLEMLRRPSIWDTPDHGNERTYTY